MIFSSALFIYFFAFVFPVNWILIPLVPQRYRLKVHHLFLLFCSYWFYMAWEWRFGLLVLFTTLVDYSIGLWLENLDRLSDLDKRDKFRAYALYLSLIINLGILAYFKYADFFIGSFVDFANTLIPGAIPPDKKNSLLLNLILPLGISFFTFQSLSYTIDVYRRVIPTERSLLRFSLFVIFFPQLVAGPIVTAKEFLPQLKRMPEFDFERARHAARWFLLGYFKKVVLADNMAPIVEKIFSNPEQQTLFTSWIGALGFWVQVYGDFSGYSDMAWGTAIFLGYRLPENFRLPYLSRSLSEHWQRWHISLIRWIRDYLYIPLGGNRVGFFRHKFNVFLTMFLAGVWHGANWTYVMWGALHGLLLGIESSIAEVLKKRNKSKTPLYDSFDEGHTKRVISGQWREKLITYIKIVAGFTTTSFVTIYLGVMFRASRLSDSLTLMGKMLGIDPNRNSAQTMEMSGSMVRSVLLAVVAVYAGHLIGHKIFNSKTLTYQPPVWLELIAFPILLLLIAQLAADSGAPFIYFVF